jgi:hypothetical protein
MTLAILSLTYLGIGVVLAFALVRRGRSLLDGVLVILAWPLYAMTLSAAEPSTPAKDEPARLVDDVRAALSSVRDAAAGSPFSTLLGAAAEARLLAELDRAAERMRAIDHELGVVELAPGRTAMAASLRAESDASLRALRASDAAAMSELRDLLGALRARIVLARHAGSSAEGPTALVSEVWARIEGLGEAVACTRAPEPTSEVSAA